MKRLLAAVFITLLLSVLTCPSGWAQATAQISGTVRDQSGAVLPGVEVTATQTDTGISRSTITNETGSYNMPNLVVGPYRLEAALPGFRTFAQTGIVLQVNGAPVINPVLEVGQVSEQIEVQANAALVETHSIGIGQVMETQRIVELPLNGRNVAELMLLSGGNVQVASPSGAGRNFPDRLVISAAGGVAQGNSQYLNPAAFAQPAPGTLGNMGRVNIDPPGTWQFDTSLSRIFRFHESQSLEFRAEAYNVLNSYRPGNPVTTLNSGTFGKIITALDPRIMQFALKYVF